MGTLAKFMAVTLGGGLLLGTIGGQLANPVMLQRAGEEPWREMLEPNIGAGDTGMMAEAPPRDLRPYGGRYSYVPAFADEGIDWPDPSMDADWPDLESDWPEPPTIAELDAQWEEDEEEMPETRVYGRTVVFPPPSSIDGTATNAEQAADEARAAADAAGATELSPDPRAADGKLPAIW